MRRLLAALFALTLTLTTAAHAQSADPFEHGWTLDGESSALRFMSIKKGDVAEINRFATLSGLITADGKAQIRVLLDSVDTGVDLRNVRMRFLFFETFLHPEATITAQLDPAALTDLHLKRRKVVEMPYTLSLHGITVERSTEVSITLISNDRVTVSALKPIPLKLTDFALDEGRQKLQEAASVNIVPLGVVNFDFVFDRASPGTPPNLPSPAAPQQVALETAGNLDREACVGRFEILSRTGNIYFGSGSARLDAKSTPLLDNLFDVANRCPDLNIQIAGHTDSDGGAAANKRLSERRAAAVRDYLAAKGIAGGRLTSVGFGEERPFVANDTPANKARNRRIEFSVVN